MFSDLFDDDDEEIVDYISTDFFDRRVLNRTDLFNSMRESDFIRRFRLSKNTTLCLLKEIEHKLEYTSDKNNSLTPINQLLCTLRFYATGCPIISCGDIIGASESTACRIIHKVTHTIAELRPKYLRFPRTDVELKSTAYEFYKLARFPRVIGAIDCTHVKILSPGGENAELFRNRKGYFSINVQAICKANLELTDVVARWHGAAHDSNIWDNCNQKRNFVQNMYGDKLLIGDSGYAQTSYMMTPLTNPTSRKERLYQESQIRTRNVIERAFGVWKRRFPVISRGINVNLKRIPGIIIATAVLHNIALLQKDEVPPEDPEFPSMFVPDDNDEAIVFGNRNAPHRERTILIEQYFARLS